MAYLTLQLVLPLEMTILRSVKKGVMFSLSVRLRFHNTKEDDDLGV